MKVGAASGAGARQGPLCRRPGRRRHRRDLCAGARRGREDRRRIRACCRAVVDPASAAKPGPPQIHDFAPDNTVLQLALGDKAATDAAFASGRACHEDRSRQQPADPERDGAARRDRRIRRRHGRDHALHDEPEPARRARSCSSALHGIAPEHKLRVIAPDVGGGFGSKIFIYTEETVCAWAAKKVGRPVKWTAERTEGFLTDAHGRDHVTHAELALDASGKILGLRVHTHRQPRRLSVDLLVDGADLPLRAAAVGPVRHPGDLRRGRRGLHEHRAVDAYRGAGRPEATFVVERIVEKAARETRTRSGRVPAAEFHHARSRTRRRSLMCYDAGDYGAALDKAWSSPTTRASRARKAASAAKGKLRGIGISAYIEACGLAPSAGGRRARRWRRRYGNRPRSASTRPARSRS